MNNNLEGEVINYYESGAVRSKQQFKDGSREGIAISYFESGAVQLRQHFKNGMIEGIAISYFESGAVKSKERFKDGKLEGEVISYFESGAVQSKHQFKEDKAEGEAIFYYESGAVKSKERSKNGKVEGEIISYFESGAVDSKHQFKEDKPEGEAIYYYESGAVQLRQHFKNGMIEGEVIFYYESGAIEQISQFKNDNIIGQPVYFNDREKWEIKDPDIFKVLNKSLRGMVNTKWFTNTFPSDLFSFISEKRSKLKLFHGPTCSGKTEIAQRLAGMREGFPGLIDIGVDVHYLTGIESEIAVRDIVDKLKPLSVVLIDEADKFLNPKSPLYSEQSAHRFTNMIITLFERKPLYWVLIGTWDFLQEGDQSMDEKVSNLYGPEFGTRVDYDWRFPDWSLETLLEAIKASVPNRKVTYDDMSLAIMAQYCLKSGGGVRSFDNLEQRLMRKLRMKGDLTHIDEILVKECFKEWKYS
jgi:antitoxin component YwqK of YwqJK toxin-antitoxin module